MVVGARFYNEVTGGPGPEPESTTDPRGGGDAGEGRGRVPDHAAPTQGVVAAPLGVPRRARAGGRDGPGGAGARAQGGDGGGRGGRREGDAAPSRVSALRHRLHRLPLPPPLAGDRHPAPPG